MLRDLIIRYGYIVIFGGCFLEGETVLVLGGITAKLGYLDLVGVMLAATAGSFLGDQLYFLIGRRYGGRLLKRLPSWRGPAGRVTRLFKRYDTWFILSFRFIYGVRTISPFVLGMAEVPHARFAILNFIAAVVWAVSVAAAGYAFAHVIALYLEQIVEYERYLLGGALLTGFAIWAAFIVRNRRRRRRPVPVYALPPPPSPPGTP